MLNQECPNCQKKSLRERSSPSLKNIRLREIGNVHAPVVCGECHSTFDVELVEVKSKSVEVDQNDAIDW